jgi:hypothetical protein
MFIGCIFYALIRNLIWPSAFNKVFIRNIPESPAYGVYISQLVHYSRTCAHASTVILWTELSCWRKSNSNKTTLLLGWSHRYKNPTVVITILLTITKYPYLKWPWIFYFLHRCFLSSINTKTFTGLYMSNTTGVL